MFKKSIILLMFLSFMGNAIIVPNTAKASVIMPEMVMLKGIKVFPDQPLVFDFVIDQGRNAISEIELTQEITTLAKFFLTTLTIPEKDLWVNLSPYEKDRVLSEDLSQTLMGERFLEQDNMLKQVASSLTDPTTPLGQMYWEKVYQKANELFGSTEDLPIDGLNKIWIIPGKITVYEKENVAVLGSFYLKVMTEKDYFAMKFQEGNVLTQDVSTDAIQEVLLPVLEREVNESASFAPLRQMFSAMILAVWYKELIKNSFLGQVYADQKKIEGVNHYDPLMPEKMFAQYVESFKKGVYHFIREEIDSKTGEMIPIKYFSGGIADASEITKNMERKPLQGVSADNLQTARVVAAPTQVEPTDNENVSDKAESSEKRVIVSSDNPDDFQNMMSRLTFNYFKALYNKGSSKEKKRIIRMFEDFFHAASMSPEDREKIVGLLKARDLRTNEEYLKAALEVVAVFHPMNGGLGTSLKRLLFLIERMKRSEFGAKAIDLYYPIKIKGYDEQGNEKEFEEQISIAEVHLLQILTQDDHYRQQIFQSFVNDESNKPLEEFFNTTYIYDRIDERPNAVKRTYKQIFEESKRSQIAPVLVQEVLPVIDIKTGLLTNRTMTPGGHGNFASLIFQETINDPNISKEEIRVIFNGDGVNNTLEPAILGWMYKEKIPVVMVTTNRTFLDAKGGIIGVTKNESGKMLPSIYELGQAKVSGQVKEFSSAGLIGEEKGKLPFNTNTVGIFTGILQPFLIELHQILGKEKYLEVMSPDLITNPKGDYMQVEGALGSSLLNLNAFLMETDIPEVKNLMKKYEMDRLVYFVNYDVEDRVEAFTPVKYAWDHWLYAYSGHFQLNSTNWRLENKVDSHLPAFLSMDKYYEEMLNMIKAFDGVDVLNLDKLSIKGVVHLSAAILKGEVIIENQTGQEIHLKDYLDSLPQDANKRIVLENAHLIIDANGKVSLESLENPEVSDAASSDEQKKTTYGGIDFEYILPNMMIERQSNQEVKVHFSNQDIVNFKNGHFDGLMPIVVDIVPFSEALFLGNPQPQTN